MNILKATALVLDKRWSSWKRIRRELANYEIYAEPFIVGNGESNLSYDRIDVDELPPRFQESIDYPTWWIRPAAYNAYLSHKAILERFLETNHDRILLLEDDILIEDDFDDLFKIYQEFPEPWSMFYLGSYNRNGTWSPTKHKSVMQVNGCAGFHACIIKREVAEILVKSPPLGPMDWQAQKLHKILPCYAIFPSIISQRSDFSFIENSRLEKPSRYDR